MYVRMWRSGVATGVVLLAWALGCQSEKQHAGPGALPAGLNPDVNPRLNASTYFAHGHLLERQGNLEQAVGQYRQALTLSPTFVSARNRLGITLNKLGRHDEASTEFRIAIQHAPVQAYLHNNLGFSLYLQGFYPEAAAELSRAIEIKPEFKRARMNHGVVLAKLGDFDAALEEFRLATSEADAHFNLGVILTEAGRFADAARELLTALQLKPDFDDAREQLRLLAQLTAQAEPPAPQPSETVAVSPADDSPVPAPQPELAAAEVAMPPPAPALPAPDDLPSDVLPDPTTSPPSFDWWFALDEIQVTAAPPLVGQPDPSVELGGSDDLIAVGDLRALVERLAVAAANNLGATCEQLLGQLDAYWAAISPTP